MTLINRIDNITKLWTMLVPHIPAPTPAWIGRWCSYGDEAIEQGIVRASKKFSSERLGESAPTSEMVWRYAGGVAANEAKDFTVAHQQATAH